MSGAAAFLIFLAVLITLSIVFNFWIYLVIAAVVVLGIAIAMAELETRNNVSTSRRRPVFRDFHDAISTANQSREERDLRNRIETEWNRFDGDDLR